MTRFDSIPLILMLAMAGFPVRVGGDTGVAGVEEPPAAVIEGMNQFAFDLYGRLAESPTDNLFLSPASISTALTMTSAGACGNTAEQMATVLRLPDQRVHEGFGALGDYLNALGAQDDFELTIVNALWAQPDYDFRREFTELLETRYGAGLRKVDFQRDTEGARQEINRWVEEQTRDRIQELIPPGVLTQLTRLVLTNAIYFQGFWEHPFDPDATRPREFTTAAGEKIETPTMFQNGVFRYAEDDAVQCLEMEYGEGDLAMTLFLPKQPDGLRELERNFDAAALRTWSERLQPQRMHVYLPKFSFTAEFGLSQVLQAMGMPDAFSRQADFSGMDGTKELYLQEVLHKAFVDVDETGTEAAAATGVVVGITAMPPVFRADRPFLFLIRDTCSGVVLFAGRLADPSTSEP